MRRNTSLLLLASTLLSSFIFTSCQKSIDSPLGAEIFGRCQHPIVTGSGTGVFNGVTRQINFKDNIEAGNFPYRGQLRF